MNPEAEDKQPNAAIPQPKPKMPKRKSKKQKVETANEYAARMAGWNALGDGGYMRPHMLNHA